MNQLYETSRPVTDVPSSRPERNGTPSLSERVRSLRLSDKPADTPARGAALPWYLFGLMLLTTLALGYRTYRVAPAGDRPTTAPTVVADPKSPAPSTMGVTPTPMAAQSGDIVLQAKGYAIPAHQVQVSPNKVSGRLVFIDPRLEEGNIFQEGDLLARIDDSDYRARRDRFAQILAEAERRLKELETTYPEEVKQAEAKLAVVRARVELSQFKTQVVRDARDAISREQRQEATLQLEQDRASLADAQQAVRLVLASRKQQIEQAKARVEQARHDLQEAQWLLDNCEIRAPISGTILRKNAERGNFVNPGALSSGTTGIAVSLCDMADLADLEVELKVQERDIANVVVGQPCLAMPEAFQKNPPFLDRHPQGYKGVVSRIMPIADRAQAAIPVRVKLQIPKGEEGLFLKPEMGVIVSFQKQ